jgi:putative ABC transport system substrate-binding protein
MSTRRILLGALGAGAALAPFALAAQPAGKPNRIGHLSGSNAAANRVFLAAFREGMRALGHVEGKTWSLDERYADGKAERLAGLAKELIALKPDVLLVATTPANIAAKAATSTIPIVMVLVADPVGVGLVASLARPGGNITGITNIGAELTGKRLEILKELVPAARRVALLVNPDNPNTAPQVQVANAAARVLGIEIDPILPIRGAADLEPAFAAAARAGAAGALRTLDALMIILRRETIAMAAKYRLPVVYSLREDVEAGGLVSYGANIAEQYRQAAALVDKILRGAKPADLPVEQPTKFDLIVNLATARALGLTVPPTVSLRATETIE